MRILNALPRPASTHRGATLTEVLMAILIMSIGVVSVITLFPLAILRAVQATQLTNSRILEKNIEDFVNSNTWMLRGSPLDSKLDSSLAADNTFFTACIIDPLGREYVTGAAGYQTQFGNQTLNTGAAVVPTYAARRISPFRALPTAPSYMAAAANTDWALTDWTALGDTVCALPDSWTQIADDVPTAVTATSVTFLNDLGSVSGDVRLTLISADGARSASRIVTVSGTVATLKTTELNLPTNLDEPFEIGRAIVEAAEPRYTWIITCPAPADAPPAASCAVFFRRSYNPEEEFVYEGASGANPIVAANLSQATIEWDATMPTPLVREGNYLFDVENCIWHQIKSYTTTEAAGTSTAVIDLMLPASKPCQGVVIPHGLVHVFDLQVRGQE
jgi:type II secretory pathway pseudopilin PulG